MGDAAEELRKLTKPAPSDEDILGILRDISIVHDDENDSANLPHDNNVQIMKELDSYDDANYLVKINGVKYLLKIHNGVESQSYINEQSQKANSGGNMMDVSYSSISLQDDMMRHLSKDVYRIKTSCPVSTSKGRVFIHELPVLSREHSPCMLAVRLLKWIEGAPMSSRPCLAIEYVAQAGELLGRVTSALDEMMDELEKDPRSAFMLTEKSSLTRYHAWDVKNTDQIVQKFVHHIEDERIRTLVNDVIESFQKDIIPVQRDFRVGIIHNDYNDANILMEDKGGVGGVIDFGDSLSSWKVNEIAIACAYAMINSYGNTGHSLASAAAMLRGFSSVYKLSSFELKHLRLLIASRLACSYTLGYYSYKCNPENEYLLLHAEPAKRALGLIWGGCDESVINALFNKACQDSNICKSEKGMFYCADISFPDPNISDPLASVRT